VKQYLVFHQSMHRNYIKKGKKRQILGEDFSNGQPRKLTKIQESQVIKYILDAQDNGDPVEGHDIVTFVKKEFDIEVSLSSSQSFQKTHSNLICETDAKQLESERGNISYSELLDYSIEMELLLKDYNFQNV
jgi:hypothetical protein